MIEAHRSSSAMARVLVQYIADPKRVRQIVRGEWEKVPDLQVIANMRAKHVAKKAEPINHTWEIDLHAQQMERANTAFLAALKSAGRTITAS